MTDNSKPGNQLAIITVCEGHPRVTPETIAEIIRLRLSGLSPRKVAEIVGHNEKTVTEIYKDFLRAGAAEILDDPAPYLFEAIERAEQGMAGAWELWLRTADVKYLAAYQRAEVHIAKLRGLEAAAKVEVSGSVEVEAPTAVLAEMLADLAKTAAANADD